MKQLVTFQLSKNFPGFDCNCKFVSVFWSSTEPNKTSHCPIYFRSFFTLKLIPFTRSSVLFLAFVPKNLVYLLYCKLYIYFTAKCIFILLQNVYLFYCKLCICCTANCIFILLQIVGLLYCKLYFCTANCIFVVLQIVYLLYCKFFQVSFSTNSYFKNCSAKCGRRMDFPTREILPQSPIFILRICILLQDKVLLRWCC
jgi:hypothetical protein